MLSLEEARQRLLAHAAATESESVDLADAVGRVLVDPRVIAAVDVPPFANSAMDGFAVRAADTPGRLRIVGDVAAGSVDLPTVEPGTAARVMTGAPLPPGADAVVPIEEATDEAGAVTVDRGVEQGRYVRAAAHDTSAGDEVCLPGQLTPAKLAVLASLGIGRVEVRGRPVVAILSTGDELVGPGEPLGVGQIHDANTVALASAVEEAGAVPLVLARQPDDEAAIEAALAEGARHADLVVTSGGVSVGRHDYVRSVLEGRGSLDFWRIAVQPGKPLAVGSLAGATVIGLPGNPVSALVTFELFVRPFIRQTLGLDGDGRLHISVRPASPMEKDRDRRAFLRVVVAHVNGAFHARPAGGQSSSQLRPMADANALLVVPEGEEAADPSRRYEAIVLEPSLLNAAP